MLSAHAPPGPEKGAPGGQSCLGRPGASRPPHQSPFFKNKKEENDTAGVHEVDETIVVISNGLFIYRNVSLS